MTIKKSFSVLVAVIAILCLVQSAALIYSAKNKLERENNTNVTTLDNNSNLNSNDIVGNKGELKPNEPDWLKKYPQLSFLKQDNMVSVVETGNSSGIIFALNKLGANNDIDGGSYQLWMISELNGNKIIDSDSLGACDDVNLNDEGNYVSLDVMRSPCEAGASHVLKYFDKSTGNLSYGLTSGVGNFGGDSTLSISDGPKTRIVGLSAEFKGSCKVPDNLLEDQGSAPIISFTGASITVDGVKKFVPSSQSKSVFCEMLYGGGFDYPSIDSARIDGDQAIFTTTFGVTITVNVKDGNWQPIFAFTKAVWPSDKPELSAINLLPDNVRLQIPRSSVPVLVVNDASFGNQSLYVSNGSTEFDGENDNYYFKLYQLIDETQSNGSNVDIKVRNMNVDISGTEPEYKAIWKENNTSYNLTLDCRKHDTSLCQTENILKGLLKEIVYVGGSYK